MNTILSHIDLNTVMLVMGGLFALFRSNKGAAIDQAKGMIESALRQLVVQLASDPSRHAQARAYLERAALAVLAKLKVKRNVLVDQAVEMLVQRAMAELAERVGPAVLLSRLDDLSDRAARMQDALEDADTNRTFMPDMSELQRDGIITVERVERESPPPKGVFPTETPEEKRAVAAAHVRQKLKP
jgi:hypothetical protein